MAIILINSIWATYFDCTYLCYYLASKTDILDLTKKAESSTDISCADVIKILITKSNQALKNISIALFYFINLK